jgi:flagellar basal-body rod protein FlgB
MRIFDKTMHLLAESMDLRAARHRVIASNIANEETPGYRAKELQFLDALSAATHDKAGAKLLTTDGKHLGATDPGSGAVQSRIVELPSPELPLDANSVNLDLEMDKLGDNAINYNAAATILSERFRQLIGAIRDIR